jgi:hypothetical protein
MTDGFHLHYESGSMTGSCDDSDISDAVLALEEKPKRIVIFSSIYTPQYRTLQIFPKFGPGN